MTRDDDRQEQLHRRRLLKWVAGGAIAATGVGVSRLTSDSERRDLPTAQLSASADDGVASLELPLDGKHLDSVGNGRWQTKQLPTSTHSLIALTWTRSSRQPEVRVRSRAGGSWQPWQYLPPLLDVPDVASAERTATAGTELVWVGAADGIQVDVRGARPADLTLVLLHPARLPAGSSFAGRMSSQRTQDRAPRPNLRTRRDWGAKRKWRSSSPQYNDKLKQIHVHHTVNSNDYSRDDVPGMIRSMYRYHTQHLGWSDIGYNFLVDRFGRIWVGRAGGARRPVRGAHTLGFNGTSCGVAVIGNFETDKPNRKVVRAVARLAAWKLYRSGRNPRGRVWVRSEGSDRYAAGERVRLRVIDGHRDTNDTACPGKHLYEALPRIRRRAKRIVDAHRS